MFCIHIGSLGAISSIITANQILRCACSIHMKFVGHQPQHSQLKERVKRCKQEDVSTVASGAFNSALCSQELWCVWSFRAECISNNCQSTFWHHGFVLYRMSCLLSLDFGHPSILRSPHLRLVRLSRPQESPHEFLSHDKHLGTLQDPPAWRLRQQLIMDFYKDPEWEFAWHLDMWHAVVQT